MATLGELRSDVLPSARLVVPTPGADVDAIVIGWVRVLRARVPAFDALEPGDLVVVPVPALDVVAPSPTELAELVAAFARARIGAVLVVGDGGGAHPVVGAACDAGLPVLVLATGEPAFLERAVIGHLVNRRAELDRQAGRLEQRIERLALEAADLPALVAEVGSFLGRAVALEGRRGDPLAVHAPVGDAASAGAVGRYLAGGGGAVLRVRLPGPRPGAGDGGALVLLGDRQPTELERVTAERIAGVLALQLARDEAVRRARDAGRRGEPLPTAGPPWVVLLARQAAPGARPSLEQREATRRELRLLAPAARLGLRGDAESLELRLVLAAAEDQGGLELAGRIAAFLGRVVAVSRPFAVAGDRPSAEADARATLEAAEALEALEAGPTRPRVARTDRLPAYRLLGGLHNIPDGARHAHALLEPLLVGRHAAVAERLATLRAVLDGPGAAEAATTLGIHRNTLAYRVRRIEALTGWRLTDPELRLALQVALRLVQTAQ